MKLKGAGDTLKELLDKGKTVYVHCTAGMGRAAATVVIYLVLYEDYSVDQAVQFIKTYRPVVCPNINVINKVVAQYKPDKIYIPSEPTAVSINLDLSEKVTNSQFAESIYLNK